MAFCHIINGCHAASNRHRLPLLGLAAAATMWCCENEKGIRAAPGHDKKSPVGEDEDADLDDGTDDTTTLDPGQEFDINKIIQDCGIDPNSLNNKDAVLFSKRIRSWPKTFAGAKAVPLLGNINYRVDVITIVDILVTTSESKQTTDFEIHGIPTQAEGPAREKTAPMRGASTSKSLTIEERTNLMSTVPAWSGIYCTAQPVKELGTSRGGLAKVVRFSPALPDGVSPLAKPERYAAELSQGKVFDQITAEIIGSSDPAFPQGKTFVGRASVTPVEPQLTLQVTGGASQTVRTDAAFRVDIDFGSVENTVGLGLMPSRIFFINHAERNFKVIVADTGFAEGGIAVLSEEF